MKKKLLAVLLILSLLVSTSCDSVDVNVLPATDSTYDIGSPTHKWAEGHFDDIYVTGDVYGSWWHEYNIPPTSFSPGLSGATWIDPW